MTHALRAAYRTAISAAQILVTIIITITYDSKDRAMQSVARVKLFESRNGITLLNISTKIPSFAAPSRSWGSAAAVP